MTKAASDPALGTRGRYHTAVSSGRRIGDGWETGARRVLIGLVDPAAAGRLAKLFEAASVLPTLVFSCNHLVREACADAYGLIILDVSFACAHDTHCLRMVREASLAPIIAVGSLDDDRTEGVDIAVDPHQGATEIVRRGAALIEMSRPVRLTTSIRWGPLELDVERHEARWHGREIRLTPLQFRIMEVLALAGGSIVTVEQLSRRVWGDASVDDRDRLVQHVRRIRKFIEKDPSRPQFLLRVRGRGLRLSQSETTEEPSEGPGRDCI